MSTPVNVPSVINNIPPNTGRMLKEDGTVVNVADLIKAISVAASDIKAASEAVKAAVEGTLTTELYGSSVTDITFHNEAVAAADGTVLTVGTNKTLTIEIYGTSTSRTIAFIGRGASGEDRALSGVNLNGLSVATGTTGSGEIWQFDITGLTSVFIDLQAVAGGNVTVKGKAVA